MVNVPMIESKQMSTSIQEFDTHSSEGTYPEPEVLAYMERQAESFEQMRSHLLSQYLGKYVLFEDGQVLDADENEAALVIRAYGETAPRPLFIKKVLPFDPQPIVRTPFRSAFFS